VACGELERCMGAQFDPEIVPVFLHQIEDFRRVEAAAGHFIPR
jgi:response regulator RpfG family c-di-GMP phosphodiesterase